MNKEIKDWVKRVAIIFNAKYALVDGVKYTLPIEKWKKEKKLDSMKS